jgi:aminoglycoside phosphotransferase (APT) family kinase protein
MEVTQMVAQNPSLDGLVDRARLQSWLDSHVPELGDAPLDVGFLHGGTSNVILSLRRGNRTMVLRRPPLPPPPGSEKAIMREARVLNALCNTNVPHPIIYGLCEDFSVVGSKFYVMERVAGWAGELTETDTLFAAPFDRMPYRYGIAFAMVDALVQLANVDYLAVGLRGFGKPDGFLQRQVDRWLTQLASYKELYGYEGRHLPGFDYVTGWLRANVPCETSPAIIHGDIGIPNTLFAPGPPPRVNALIDWELSTIGDPLLDLCWFINALRDEREPDVVPGHWSFSGRDLPTRQEMARYYAAGTGRDISALDYYLVLALFKSICIVEYKVAQAAIGKQPEWIGRFFGRLVLSRVAEAEKIARRSRL